MYECHKTVAVSDVGTDKKMSVGALANLISDCELFQIDSDKYFSDFLTDNNFGMYLSARQIDILRMPNYFETVKAATAIYELQNAFGYRNTFIYGADGEILAKCYATGILVDLNTNRLTKVPSDFLNGFKLSEKLPMEYLPRRIEISGDATEAAPFVVPRSFIDRYGHVNNARYICAAAEYLPDNISVSRIRVEHKAAAKYGDVMKTIIYKSDGKIIHIFRSDDFVYSIIEFCY